MPLSVVTGGAGFIGSHLVEALLAQGNTVRVIDNLATGSRENLSHLSHHRDLSFHHLDVTDAAAIAPVFQDAEWVFHLAGLADIVPSVERPLDYHRANVDGTVIVLEAARQAGARRLVYAASSSCYGMPEALPMAETAPMRPQYPYALSKYLGELCVLHWGDVYQLPVISLRLFNVYGPRSRTSGAYGAVFGVFLAQKLANRPLTVVGDGTQSRDFVFVTDVVNAMLAAALSDCCGNVFNVGSGVATSINRLATLLGGNVVLLPKRPGEPDCTLADISRIQQVLGWKPKVSIEAGVDTMLQHIEHWRNSPVWTPESIAKATTAWFEHLGKNLPHP